MARVTVEDCIEVVNNRFELVLLAAQRARDISAGQQLEVDRDNDKNPVVALREIADKLLDLDDLREHIARGVNRHSDMNIEDDTLEALSLGEKSWPSPEEMAEAASAEITEISFDEGGNEKTASDSSDDSESADDAAEGEEEAGDLSDEDVMASADLDDVEVDEGDDLKV